jgi:phage I-like protein
VAEWTTAYVNSLPDGSFLYVAPGGTKDGEGKTTPRTLRHFPVKDANGKVDLPHVRNALARIPQSDVPPAAKKAATAKAEAMLKAAEKSASAARHALSSIIALKDGKAPTAFRIFRAGKNTSDKGTFTFDEDSATKVMAAYERKVGDSDGALTMDYEHQSLNTILNGQPAPNSARAWRPEVRQTSDGPELWAVDVMWTSRAKTYIEEGEYQYISPVFDAPENHIERVVNLALTNIPALDGLEPLIAASARASIRTDPDMDGDDDTDPKKDPDHDGPMYGLTNGENPMKSCTVCSKAIGADDEVVHQECSAGAIHHKMATALGLGTDASQRHALSAVSSLVALRSTLFELTGKGAPEEALAVIAGWKGRETEVQQLRTQLADEGEKRLRAEWDKVLDDAATTGRLAPQGAERKAITESLLSFTGGKVTEQSVKALRQQVEAMAPKGDPIRNGDGKQGGKQPPEVHGALTEDDRVAASLFGRGTDPDYLKRVKTFKDDLAASAALVTGK